MSPVHGSSLARTPALVNGIASLTPSFNNNASGVEVGEVVEVVEEVDWVVEEVIMENVEEWKWTGH